MKRRLIVLASLMLAAFTLCGCATPKEGEVSAIPWNRPQTWEGQGAFGGFRPPGSQHY